MKNSPFFSVVIPTYNRASWIKKTIQSVTEQDFKDFEILVIDDGSTDDTEKIIASILDERMRYIKKVNGERGAARNTGTQYAKGQYINFIDSDDLIYPHHLSTAFTFIKANLNCQVFHLGYDIKNENGKILRHPGTIFNINKQIIHGNLLSCNGVFIKKNVAFQNPFNEDRALASLEDWELWIRLAAKFPFLHSQKITSTVIQHPERSVLTSNTERIKQKVNKFVSVILDDQTNLKVFRKGLTKAVASANTYAALHLALAGAEKHEIIQYLLKGLKQNPIETFNKRFFVIIKLLILR